jgi:predicted nucleic acid-binding Zn ribbon protein
MVVEAIGNTLPAVFKRQVRREESQLAELLVPLWARVAGKAVAEHSRPVAFWNGTLTLAAHSETWASQLPSLEAEILDAVNGFLGAPLVKRLRVRLAPSAERVEAKSAVRTQARKPRDAGALDCHLPHGLDPETQDVLERSFSKYFARGGKRLS